MRAQSSGRARAFALWAGLRSLGRDGVAEMVERCCRHAARVAETVGAEPGVEILNDVVLNQVLVRVGDEERTRAVALPNALKATREAIRGGTPVSTALRTAKQALVDAGFLRIDYVALVDAATLEPLDEPRGEMRLIAAAVIGTTRLIDNMAL